MKARLPVSAPIPLTTVFICFRFSNNKKSYYIYALKTRESYILTYSINVFDFLKRMFCFNNVALKPISKDCNIIKRPRLWSHTPSHFQQHRSLPKESKFGTMVKKSEKSATYMGVA